MTRWALVAAIGACAPRAAPRAPAPATSVTCEPASCGESQAIVAAKHGDLDVAAVWRGRAFAQAPTLARLIAWVEALRDAGAPRRAHEALRGAWSLAITDAKWAERVESGFLAQEMMSAATPLLPEPATEAVRAAYREKDLDTEVLTDPYHLVHAADLALARHEEALARELWARARAIYDERGATLELVPIASRRHGEALWSGEQRVRDEVHELAVGYGGHAEALYFGLSRWEQRVSFARPGGRMFLQGDETLLRSEGGALVEYDVITGIRQRRSLVGAVIEDFVVAGAGDATRVLVRRGRSVVLSDLGGEQYAEAVALWEAVPPVLALAADGRTAAIGEEGPQVRVIDPRGGPRVLKFPSAVATEPPGEEIREPRGVLAVGFSRDGGVVTAIDSLGTITSWALRTGGVRRTMPGRCSRDEALASRLGDGDGLDAATYRACRTVKVAAIGPDADTVISVGEAGNVRIREVTAGRTIARPLLHVRPVGAPVFSPAGQALLVDEGVGAVFPESEPGWTGMADEVSVYVMRASLAGRILGVKRGARVDLWDLASGEIVAPRLAPGEVLLALDGAGQRAWVRTREHVVLRAVKTGKEVRRLAVSAQTSVAVGEAPVGWSLLVVAVAGGWEHHVDGPETSRVVRLARPAMRLSAGGRWLVTDEAFVDLAVAEVATGETVYTRAEGAERTALAADAAVVAWREPDRGGEEVVHAQRFDRLGEASRRLEVDGRVLDVVVPASGEEVLVLLDGGLVRWWPWQGRRSEHWFTESRGFRELTLSSNEAALILQGGGAVEIVANDVHLRRLATVYPLDGGGWVALAGTGAVDGSIDAPNESISRVSRGGEALIFGGWFAWHGARVPGLVARALAGEEVQPPGFVRAASRERGLLRVEASGERPVVRPRKR